MKAEPFEIGDAFSLRTGERVQLRIDGIGEGDTLAVMCAPVPSLPSPSATENSRGSVESYCVVAAQLTRGKWQWMQLAPDTKECVGDILFDSGLERGKWYGVLLTKSPETTDGK